MVVVRALLSLVASAALTLLAGRAGAAGPCDPACRQTGQCTLVDEECQVGSHADCQQSLVCEDEGRCVRRFVYGVAVCSKGGAPAVRVPVSVPETKPVAAPKPKPRPAAAPKPASKPYVAPSSGPVCKKGCRCGNACISCSKRCRK